MTTPDPDQARRDALEAQDRIQNLGQWEPKGEKPKK
jgi:hypothetical protein